MSLFSHVPRAQSGAAGGSGYTILLVDGEVWTAGDNYYGQLGVGGPTGGSARYYRTKVVPFGAAAVAAGVQHSLAMMSDGSMYGWGLGTSGQLGVTPANTHTSPIAVPLSGITAISASGHKSYAVGPGGVVYMFGQGLLGDGTSHKNVFTPTQVPNITGVTAVAAGGDHVLLLKSDGTVLSWGSNNAGQVGDGTTTTRLTPQPVPGLTDIVQIGAGSGHSVALTSTGQVYAWGGNSAGSVGDGTQTNRLSPVLVTGLNGLTITQISAGYYHTLARASDGTVHAWGSNGAGQIGDGSVTSMRLSPTFITTLSNVITKVAATSESSFAFAADGRVWGWGSNGSGQLGNGTNAFQSTPTLLAEAGGTGGNWIVGTPVFSGSYPNTYGTPQTVTITTATPGATLRYTTNGNVPTESDTVVPAGGVYIDQSMTIKARAFKTGSPASPVTSGTWLLKVNAVGAAPYGTTYTSAVNVTLSTSSPGAELRYTLDGSQPSITSPLYQTPLPIATRTTVKVKGFRAGWDPSDTTTHDYYFNYGKLAAPTMSPGGGTYETDQTVTLTAMSGAQIRYTTNGSNPYSGSTLYTAPLLINATTTLKATAFHVDYVTSDPATGIYTLQVGTPTLSLTSGAYTPGQIVTMTTTTPGATLRFTTNGVAPTATDAVVPATGIILGNFTLKVAGFKTGYNTSPVVTANYALTGDLTARSIAARYYSSFTLSKDGLLSAFGYNGTGHLGDNTTTQRTVPIRVQGITGVVDVSAGPSHTLAVTHSGQVYAWGDNGYGRLGDNTNTQRRLPVIVGGLPPVTRVAAGGVHSLAVTAAGQVYAWGYNGNGRLGDGTSTDRWVPTLVPGLSNVVGVAAGESHSLAWTSTGTVWAWGANNAGQLGDGSSTQRMSPVQITTLSNVAQLVAGINHSIALTSTGAVYAWGENGNGQIGDGSQSQRTSPVLISALSNITALGAGAMHSLAVTSTGAVYAWGYNANYQLGDGTQTRRTSPVLLAGISNAARVTGGQTHSLAVDNNGEVWSWGQGPYGALGNGFSNADPGATVTTPALLNPGAVPAPSVSPTPGTYLSAQNVTLTASTGIIRYTLDGSEPNASSAIYTTPLFVGVTTTVKAKAFQNDWTPSPTTTAVYTIQEAATPVIVPPTGTYQSPQTVTITTTTSGATIRYTLDGTEPSISSTEYSAGFEVSASTTVKAKAFKSGFGDSPTATSVITLNYGTLATPTASPAADTYLPGVEVTLSGPAGATLRYTTDNTAPTASSTIYTAPIVIAATTTLQARAFKADWTPSAPLVGTYTISTNQSPTAVNDTITTKEDTPIVVPVLANDTDPDNDTLTVTAVTQGTRGSVAIGFGGRVVYTPLLNQSGPDNFTYTIADTHGHTAVGAVAVTVEPQNDAPTVTLTASPATGNAPVTVEFLAAATDVDGDTLSYAWTFGDGQQGTGPVVTPHIYASPGVYVAMVTVNDGHLSVTRTAVVTVNSSSGGEPTPPDPTTVAPPPTPSEPTPFSQATQFLYAGPAPVQRGTATNAIDPARVSVVRGHVMDGSGTHLSDVRVTAHGQSQVGYTLTRVDGMFDLAVNGGGVVVVRLEKAGYLPAQRRVSTSWQDYEWMEDVRLMPLDPAVTTVSMGPSTTAQVMQASPVSDDNGARRATIIVPESGVRADIHLPDGTVNSTVSALSIRATEYTVGTAAAGRQNMPGDLPPTSGYTYAVELTADEAIAAGAVNVTFDKPLAYYVENFLEFPVGGIVPVGYYDRERAVWVAGENGLIIKILSIDPATHVAAIDIDGSDTPAGTPALEALGVTPGELVQLGTLYTAGQSLWRVPIAHFTPWDCNWPYGPPPGAQDPDLSDPDDNDEDCDTCEYERGSIIDSSNQGLGEGLEIAGTPFSLSYRSSRQPGHLAGGALDIELSKNSISAELKRIDVAVTVAGKRILQSFTDPEPNLRLPFQWDGKDAFDRHVFGRQKATVTIDHVYDAVYYEPAALQRSFGLAGSSDPLPARGRNEVLFRQEFKKSLSFDPPLVSGLGGWSLDVHHSYDVEARRLTRGDGSEETREFSGLAMSTLAGGGLTTPTPAGVPFADARLSGGAIAMAADGSVVIADISGASTFLRVDTDGLVRRLPDMPVFPFAVKQIAVDRFKRMWVAKGMQIPDCEGNSPGIELWRLDSDNVWRQQTSVITPSTVTRCVPYANTAVGSDDTVFFSYGRYLYQFRTDDPAPTLIHTATESPTDGIHGLAVGRDGSVYFAILGAIKRWEPSGTIVNVAGTGVTGFSGDGGPALTAQLATPTALNVQSDGSLVFYDMEHTGINRVRRIGSNGVIMTIAGGGAPSSTALADGEPVAGKFLSLSGLAIGPDGKLWTLDSAVRPKLRTFVVDTTKVAAASIRVASSDGSEIYVFENGRHAQTIQALSGVVLLRFEYDSEGRLIRILDEHDLATAIERGGDGTPLAIVSPFGQRTELALDANGMLESVTDPTGRRTELTYQTGGLLTALKTPKGDSYVFGYDALGRLISDQDPAGGLQTLTKTKLAEGWQVDIGHNATPGVPKRISTERLANGDQRSTSIDRDGSTKITTTRPDGTTTVLDSTGLVVTSTTGPDSRFGTQVQLPVSITMTTPGGLSMVTTHAQSTTLSVPNDPLSVQNHTETTVVNNRTFSSAYNASTRTLTSTSPQGRTTTTTFDTKGRPTQVVRGNLLPITMTYDTGTGQVLSVIQSERQTLLGYDQYGEVNSVTDGIGQTVNMTRDAAGRLLTETMPSGQPTVYTYDDNGNATSVTPPGEAAHTYTFNAIDLWNSYTPPAPGVGGSTATYRLDQQPAEVSTPGGHSYTYTYDAVGRPQSLDGDGQVIGWTYAPSAPLIATLSAPDATLTYTYDAQLPLSEQWTGSVAGRVDITWNNNFWPATESVNGAHSVSFDHDLDGLLTSAGALSITRHPSNGVITGTTLGSIVESRTLNGYGEPVSRSFIRSGTIYAATYGRDDLGRITSKTETIEGVAVSEEYTYDTVGRLWTVRRGGALAATYLYDENGNRTSATTSGGATTATHDGQDRLTAMGAVTYTYTPDGERLTKTVAPGETTTYTYDAFGNLRSVAMPGGTTVSYLADGMGRRIARFVNGVQTNAWLYSDALRPVAELDASGVVIKRFVYAIGVNVPDYMVWNGTTYRFITDHLGSVRLVVNDATGAIAQRIDYDEWGRVTNAPDFQVQPFGFGGGLYDPLTGLVRFGARDYDPESGRWTAKDPIQFAGGDTNLYAYVGNMPTTQIDPSGLAPTGAIVRLVAGSMRIVRKGLPYRALLKAASKGEDVLCGSRRMAKRIAKNLSGGRKPKHNAPHGPSPDYKPHYHPVEKGANGKFEQVHPHVFYSVASLLTVSHYAEGHGAVAEAGAFVADLFNPLSLPNDLLELYDAVRDFMDQTPAQQKCQNCGGD